MTYEEKVEWLKGYIGGIREMNDVAERVVVISAQVERTTARISDIPISGTGKDHLQECVDQLCELRERYAEIAAKNVRNLIEIEDRIAMVEREEDRTLLRKKYIDGLSFSALADETHYSIRHIKRKLGHAVKELTI